MHSQINELVLIDGTGLPNFRRHVKGIMARAFSNLLYLTVVVLLLGGCTASQIPESGDASDEVQPTSQPVSTTTVQPVFTITTIEQAVATSGPSTLPVIDDPLDKKPELSQAKEISATTSVQEYVPTEPTLDLDETAALDSEARPEIRYTSEPPPAGFRGVLYAGTNYRERTIDFQFLDAQTNTVSDIEVTGSYAIDCWSYFVADSNEWKLMYDDNDPATDGSVIFMAIRGHWGEIPIAGPTSVQETNAVFHEWIQSASQFVTAETSIVLTNYDNGFSLDVNGVTRDYHVQHWNYSNYRYGDEEDVPSKSEPDTGLVSSVSEGGRFWASLHGTDGELFAISMAFSEPTCGGRFVYFVSMVTGEIVHCTWTNKAKFLLVAPPDQTNIVDEIRLPPSGWFSNEPCTNEETDLADLAAVLETRGRLPDN